MKSMSNIPNIIEKTHDKMWMDFDEKVKHDVEPMKRQAKIIVVHNPIDNNSWLQDLFNLKSAKK